MDALRELDADAALDGTLPPLSDDDAIADGIEGADELSNALTAAAMGAASADEHRMAGLFKQISKPSNLRTRVIALGPPRGPRGRERRPGCSNRARGSRRGATRSSSRGGDSGDPHEAGGTTPLVDISI